MNELRAALDAMPDHFPVGVRPHDGTYDDDDRECVACGEDWPCPTSKLIVAARAARAAVASTDSDGLDVEDLAWALGSVVGIEHGETVDTTDGPVSAIDYPEEWFMPPRELAKQVIAALAAQRQDTRTP